MSTSEFLKSPWLNSHPAFDGGAFNIRPAPEFSTGEVVMASLYRSSGFSGVSEQSVPASGRDFDKAAHRDRKHEAEAGRILADTWRTVLDRVIQSPKVARQSSKRFLSLSPIVPDAALYSGSARLTGNSWNPGQLVQRMIQMGAPTAHLAQSIWMQLHEALTVQTDDDVWARWLQSEFEPRRVVGREWQPTELMAFDGLPHQERAEFPYPAQQFVVDLQGIINAKPAMTRRQWVSLLEAVLRIGTVSHVLWLCRVNDKLWRAVGGILGHGDEAVPSSRDEVVSHILAGKQRVLSYGNPAIPTMKDYASKYLSARLGLNAVLWRLQDLGSPVTSLKSAGDLWRFIQTVDANADALRGSGVLESFYALQDQEVRTINCKKGVGSNLIEFSQHTLGQRQTMDASLRGYDQGYFLRKRGDARNSPWVLAPGPAAVLAMAHCCLHEVKGPRSVQRLAVHLGAYGIECDVHGLNDSDLGRQLRMLGLVLDSPDAESGMLLVPPFLT